MRNQQEGETSAGRVSAVSGRATTPVPLTEGFAAHAASSAAAPDPNILAYAVWAATVAGKEPMSTAAGHWEAQPA